MPTIELDCPPGNARPWNLIVDVCEGTDLPVTDEPVFCFFGHAVWQFDVDETEWNDRIRPIIRPRIEALYEAGAIRAGSW